MAGADYALEMSGVSKEFPGVKALDSVTLRVRPGTVHALMGENGAGKSTLMKCLFGMYTPDSGTIALAGETVSLSSSRAALDHGIAMIHQELQPVAYRSVMENLWLGRYPLRRFGPLKLVDHQKMLRDTQALFQELRMDIDPTAWAVDLPVSKLQSMEIAKAVSRRAKIIIMDEPTSSLTEHEVEHLFEIINRLRREGVAIIYISHKMEEILRISDEVTIMRDGRLVGTYPSSELTTDLIIQRMVGRDMTHRFPPRENDPGEVVMRVEGLTSADPRSFEDVSFELRRGEILGVSGLVGAQRTEVMEALFGLRSVAKGRVIIDGKEAQIGSPIKAIARGMALLTEERRSTGIFPMLHVADNTLSASWKNYKRRAGLLDLGRAEADVRRLVEALRVKTPSTRAFIQNLSGGNQQKVILARWLLTSPDILILDEPTRGVDVGAKYEIYTIIADLAKRGKSIILISSELPEVLGMSDRILVMCEGRVTGTLEGKSATQEEIMSLSTQFR
ncbi:sugar ABC transporter ATP-binding protein [Sorangium sp. So ce834]|uniref:sugar ABC transporter ATP-binding protein n=1 Tax=Sorangium sp. So ce834 TaxID=3133321 RepID=UPI003F5FDDEA